MAVLSCHHIMYLRGILPKKVIFHLQMLENMFIIQLSVLHFIWMHAMNRTIMYCITNNENSIMFLFSSYFYNKQNIVNN